MAMAVLLLKHLEFILVSLQNPSLLSLTSIENDLSSNRNKKEMSFKNHILFFSNSDSFDH